MNNKSNNKVVSFKIISYADYINNAEEYINMFRELVDDIPIEKYEFTNIDYSPFDLYKDPKLYKYSDRAWMNQCKKLINGESAEITISMNKDGYKNPHSYGLSRYILAATIGVSTNDELGKREKSISEYVNGIGISIDMSECTLINIDYITTLFKKAFIDFKGDYGYIFTNWSVYSGALGSTIYEARLKSGWDDGICDYTQRAGGYFWGNMLSAKHMQRLGGIDRVRTESPFAIIEELDNIDNPKMYYCQLNNDIFALDKEKFLELRQYLSPIIPKGISYLHAAGLFCMDKYKLDECRLFFTEEEGKKLEEIWYKINNGGLEF